jgi:hypothetical protein
MVDEMARHHTIFVLAVALAACSSIRSGAAAGDAGGEDAALGDGGVNDAAQGDGVTCTEVTCALDVIENGLYGPVSIAVDATHLYFVEVGTTIPQGGGMGQLSRLPKGTTCADRSCFDVLDYQVLSGELEGQYIYDTHLALGPRDVCYTQSFNATAEHSIACFALSGLTKRSLDDGTGDVVALWIDGASAYWATASSGATASDGAVRTKGLTSANDAGTVAAGRANPTSVTSDGARVWWSETGGGASRGTVNASQQDGGVLALAKGQATPAALAIYGGYVYWIDLAARTVMRALADGSGAPEQIATTDENPFAIAVDASGVYWASAGPGTQSSLYGSIARSPLGPGGPTTVMITHLDGASALALDADDVYVASVGTQLSAGRIGRMKKTAP